MPECETVVRTIRPFVWGCKIIGFLLNSETKKPEVKSNQVEGRTIHHVSRIGKYIVFKLDDGFLVSHLRMTGQWYFSSSESIAPNARKHFRWGFSIRDHGGKFSGFLWFKDPRKFGTLVWVKSLSDYKPLQSLGPDGLSLDDPKNKFKVVETAGRSRRPVKNLLLDQKVIAGVGNIYASEVLFYTQVNPFEKAKNVPSEKIQEICQSLYDTFNHSVDLGGSSVSDYTGGRYNEVLQVYGRDGQPCYECDNPIEKTKQAGRSTFYCYNCQGVRENELS